MRSGKIFPNSTLSRVAFKKYGVVTVVDNLAGKYSFLSTSQMQIEEMDLPCGSIASLQNAKQFDPKIVKVPFDFIHDLEIPLMI